MYINSIYIWYLIFWIIFFAVVFQKSLLKKNNEYVRINSYMLGPDELEKYARQIAKTHSLSDDAGSPKSLIARMDDNFLEIITVYKSLNADVMRSSNITPAAEWLLDNFYIIEEQVKIIRRDLIKHKNLELGMLKTGYLKGFPRIYAVALELVAHLDGKLEDKTMLIFLKAYQSQNILTMSELWILPLMLESALIENIRTICEKISESYVEKQKVAWLTAGNQEQDIKNILDDINGMRSVSPPYIEHLVKLIRKEGLDQGQILNVLDNKLEEFDVNVENIIQEEHQEQAARQLTMGNSIISLKFIANFGWNEIFEQLSKVDEILHHDPAAVYGQMDFESRDFYRQEVEKLAKILQLSETNIARKAVELARAAAEKGNSDEKMNHVGFYLIDKGRHQLAGEIDAEIELDLFKRWARQLYFLPVMILTAAIVIASSSYAYFFLGTDRTGLIFLAGLATFIPAASIAINLVNWWLVRMVGHRLLPKLKFSQGIPRSAATILVMPSLLYDVRQAEKLVDQLEVHYHSNREDNLYFAILGDFPDAEQEKTEADGAIIAAVLRRVAKLNQKYAPGADIFYYFQRSRKYASREKMWRGWERKRGAIVEFNELIRGAADTSYFVLSADPLILGDLQYVITINDGTKIPIGMAKRLIGTICHPLNKAVFDPVRGIVTEGYGLIQPKISVNLETVNSSFFTRIFAGQTGFDPDTQASSDIYQDLFDEGSFTGQGIYHIDTYRSALGSSIADNSVLSPDLIAGCYLRTGLVTHLNLVAAFPSDYLLWMTGNHRRVRGDWQMTRWLLPRVKNRQGEKIANPLSVLSKWKIINNLRKGIEPISLFLLLTLGLTLFPGKPVLWLGFGLLAMGFSLVLDLINYLLAKHYSLAFYRSYGNFIFGSEGVFYQSLLALIFLPYNAYLMADAMIRTTYRLIISRKNLWQWISSADAQRTMPNDYRNYIQRMYPALFIALAFFTVVLFFEAEIQILSLPLITLWILSPVAAYYVSRPDKVIVEPLDEDEKDDLRRLARKTWHYYEAFVSAENNFLPPDNFQEDPYNGIAPRTSPTNIGLYLMAIAAARDLGFVSLIETKALLAKSITTIESMEKWHGHLFNWYDTRTLEVLRPRYISSVDSGNFVSHLMTLKQAILEYLRRPLICRDLARGVAATLVYTSKQNLADLENTRQLVQQKDISLAEWRSYLAHLSRELIPRTAWDKQYLKMIAGYQEELDQLTLDPQLISNFILNDNDHSSAIKEALGSLQENPSLALFQSAYQRLLLLTEGGTDFADCRNRIAALKSNVDSLIADFDDLIQRIDALVANTQLKPLYSPKKHLFSIGYNLEEEKLTDSYYDLLASEARITSYLAVVRREVPTLHWYKLGKALVDIEGYRGLVSWTGTMFEYFMPTLIMKSFGNTILDETYHFVVDAQQMYGDRRGVPWGTSESGYYAFDLQLNYQYQAFGVPDLGLKRGLIRDMVVSPYSCVLGMAVDPRGCMENIKRLTADGLIGNYGFFEAVDYTPERIPEGKTKGIVKSYMAHHQGMIFIALNNYLHNNVMQRRFHHDPMVQAGELLLQERIPPRTIVTKEYKETVTAMERPTREIVQVVRNFGLLDGSLPACHLLSNREYSVLLTNTGSGYSRNKGIQVTRWREDSLKGKMGIYIFLHQVNTQNTWSATYDPLDQMPEDYQVSFSPHKADIIRTCGEIGSHLEVFISPEDDAEIRRITIQNHSQEPVTMEVTSYYEIVLALQAADLAHPVFSNLFVRTEFIPKTECLLASRRPRAEGQKPVWSVHSIVTDGETVGGLEYETDRAKFIGRGRDISCPLVLEDEQPLSNTVGPVLDPMMSLRRRIKIASGKSAQISFIIGVTENRQNALALAEKYNADYSMNQAIELSGNRSDVEMGFLNLQAEDLVTVQNMIAHLVFLSPMKRKYQDILLRNQKGQPGLWPYGISGDLPVVLLVVKETEDLSLIQHALKSHEFWRLKGLSVDLVILDTEEGGYLQPMRDAIRDLILISSARNIQNTAGGVYALSANVMPAEDIVLLHAAARIILLGGAGTIDQQLATIGDESVLPEIKEFRTAQQDYPVTEEPLELLFDNGFGGFSQDGREYWIRLSENRHTPAPWINVIANKNFGFQVSESGSGFSWSENSRENKLTPWSNDPVIDNPSEVFYLRDESTGEFWSLTPLPIRAKEAYTIQHGLGYSRFHHQSHGIVQELTLFVPLDDAVKINLVKLKNNSDQNRILTVTYYLWPVMGVSEQLTQQYIVTGFESTEELLTISNPYNSDFPGRISLLASSEKIISYTGDREEFIGRYHDLKMPQAMIRQGLSNRVGAGFNPCAAVQVFVELNPQEEKKLVFLLGQSADLPAARLLAEKYRQLAAAEKALEKVGDFWREKLGVIQVKTPDPSMDTMINAWLLYQSISCRLWARSAFYQSGGAYGFRDQLQDALSLLYCYPELTRQQILLHCAHQFVEGDVQHWWHPGAGEKGIRTRFSDDLLWLPYVTAEYLSKTGDETILQEEADYLEDSLLEDGVDERYGVPKVSAEKSSVYEHCIRAIDKSLKLGERGIPLMGSGDWNDGMNTVGNKGRGESIWLGWFLCDILKRFSAICETMNEGERAQRYLEWAKQIAANIEENAWDGGWYRRAYFDDGRPLGSAENTECKIDSLAQSWAAISSSGQPDRIRQAMAAVDHHLVRRDDGLIMLFTPPFDEGDLHPGYIKGYLPGVRENGGQYTHAAVWVIYALAKMGQGDQAWELFHLINPINHARTAMECATYKVEPYVMAADIYAVNPHVGRGGWTWYTGAAGWMYDIGLEWILGLKIHGDKLIIQPCIPEKWTGYEMTYRFKNTVYHIEVKNPQKLTGGAKIISVDGLPSGDDFIILSDDQQIHQVEVILG